MLDRIPVAGPWITSKEIEYVSAAATNAWYDNANIYHQKFESAFAEYIGMQYATALPSCTSAIHLALAALGIGPGDEVIVPDSTWIASAAPIQYVGATPVFADVDVQTWCISVESVRRYITPATKAIIFVDLYGNLPNLDALCTLRQETGIPLIEDAAEAIGAEFQGRRAGSFGDVGVFSFHGSKTLTTGEGGMLVTNRQDVFERVIIMRDHGRHPGDTMFFNAEVGFKYKMSSLQAALGLAQLERIDELIERKRTIFSWYVEELNDVPELTLNFEAPETRNVYWMNSIILDQRLGVRKEQLIEWLRAKKIDCRPFFYPLSSLPAFRSHRQAQTGSIDNPIAYQLGACGVNLPSALLLDRRQVAYVCEAVRSFLESIRTRHAN
ncbi:MAG: DegT/DnrJ/EryC1/StrS family aminotransferase [Caldilinea sp.]|nr:DegT/DnrJ/EryC1/StrS family aminotransferase [Caldilinea sp.]